MSSCYKIVFNEDATLYLATVGVRFGKQPVYKYQVHLVEVRPGQDYEDLVQSHGMHLFYDDVQRGAEVIYLGAIELAKGSDKETIVNVVNNKHVEGVPIDTIVQYQQGS